MNLIAVNIQYQNQHTQLILKQLINLARTCTGIITVMTIVVNY